MKKISIIIPTHNNHRRLRACIESVWKNTKKPYEIIVINNNSQDATEAFLDSVKSVVHIKSPNNLYFTKAINKGLKSVKSDYVFCLNDDCAILRDDWQEFYLSCLKMSPSIGAVGPYWKNILELPYGWIEPYATLYPKRVFDKLGPLPYYGHDFVLWWSDIYHAYKMMRNGHYLFPLSRSLTNKFVKHFRIGESGQTVLRYKKILPKRCFKWHGKKLMYKRLGIKDEKSLCGYYKKRIFQCSDFKDRI